MIPFNIPPFTGKEMDYIRQAVENQKICGDGPYTKKCSEWIEQKTGTAKCLLTTSCTHATELAALLADVKEGDEVIMPAYTFVSTADAFVLRGAKPVFVDIRPDTMNIDEKLIEAAVTEKTKVIVPVHYAGVACEMDTIMDIADRHHLMVVEDDAQGIMSTYKGKPLGTFGEFGALSFHETKNYSMGEGGALLIRDEAYIEKAEILREKGVDERLVHAVVSHGYLLTVDVQPEHQMEKVLYATDELTGLIGAVVRMLPTKSVQDLQPKSLKKKFKDKKFAAGCSREVIERGADMLGWTLDELMEQTIAAMQVSPAANGN